MRRNPPLLLCAPTEQPKGDGAWGLWYDPLLQIRFVPGDLVGEGETEPKQTGFGAGDRTFGI
jgi:hypothetical protein